MGISDPYKNLMTKDIYAILDGDESYGEYESRSGKKVRIALPYLSGPVLCDISTKFGKPVDYVRGGGGPSRWSYVEEILDHCIKNGTCSTLLRFLFSRAQFQDAFRGLDIDEIEDTYKKSVNAVINGINRELLFSGVQLVYRDKKFVVIPTDKTVLTDDEMLDSIFVKEKMDPFSSLSEYEQCERLGQGGFGEVYRYHNNNLDMDFAVKIYNPWFVSDDEREEGEKRFFREAKMLFNLNHPNIVRIYDAGRIDGNPFIRMELINGDSLDKFRAKKGNLTSRNALKAVRQILRGLSYAHNAGIIHRDLKPQNVVVGEYEKKLRCVIIDFGISAFMETEGYTRLTRTGEHIAGGQYIDPRLMENSKLRDPRSDIYSAGAILYYLLCGRAPVGSDIENYLQQSNSDVDEKLMGILRKSLSSELDNRYDSCDQFIRAINEIVGDET